MTKLILGLVIGLIVGGSLTFLLFVGVPRASQTPGSPMKAPDTSIAPGSAQIVLRQEFFNELLTTIFRDLSDPAFPLGLAAIPGDEQPRVTHAAFQDAQLCDGKIMVRAEGSGVTTSVRFENNRISAPFAFAGNYYTPFGCIQFTGWAQANLELRYDPAVKTVFGRINVETVNLDGVNPIVSGIVTPLVQTTLNNRVNPITVLSGDQIAIDVPIASAAGRLRATVRDVRAEFKDDALHLYVIYGFSGAPVQ